MAGVMKVRMRPWIESVSAYIRKGQETGEVHAGVDPEAYVVQVMTSLISTIAVQRLLAPLPDARAIRELLRAARAALFVSGGPTAPARPRTSRRTR
jgi:hypothetical protein